jgi:hypothetical protein
MWIFALFHLASRMTAAAQTVIFYFLHYQRPVHYAPAKEAIK